VSLKLIDSMVTAWTRAELKSGNCSPGRNTWKLDMHADAARKGSGWRKQPAGVSHRLDRTDEIQDSTGVGIAANSTSSVRLRFPNRLLADDVLMEPDLEKHGIN